jgi:hypothetical protein
MKISDDKKLVKCFGNRVGEWDVDADRIRIIGLFTPGGEIVIHGTSYGQGFTWDHSSSFGDITELELNIVIKLLQDATTTRISYVQLPAQSP